MLTDDDIMIFGEHKGRPLGQVPVAYWEWSVEQGWFREKFPRLYHYATHRVRRPTSLEDTMRMVRHIGRYRVPPPPRIISDSVIEDPYADA